MNKLLLLSFLLIMSASSFAQRISLEQTGRHSVSAEGQIFQTRTHDITVASTCYETCSPLQTSCVPGTPYLCTKKESIPYQVFSHSIRAYVDVDVFPSEDRKPLNGTLGFSVENGHRAVPYVHADETFLYAATTLSETSSQSGSTITVFKSMSLKPYDRASVKAAIEMKSLAFNDGVLSFETSKKSPLELVTRIHVRKKRFLGSSNIWFTENIPSQFVEVEAIEGGFRYRLNLEKAGMKITSGGKYTFEVLRDLPYTDDRDKVQYLNTQNLSSLGEVIVRY